MNAKGLFFVVVTRTDTDSIVAFPFLDVHALGETGGFLKWFFLRASMRTYR